MNQLTIDNYIITTPLLDIIYKLRLVIKNGKLREVKPGRTNIVVTCPNNEHDGGKEAHPACNVYIGNNADIPYGYFRCFVCGEQGTFVKFVAHCFDSSEAYAKKWLIENYGVKAFDKISLGADIVVDKNRSKPTYLDESILENFQHWTPYLAQRGLTRETCARFNIRYDSKYRQVIFPCYNANGKLVMLAKRAIDFKRFHLDESVSKPVYCLDYIIKNNYNCAVITEGLIDCLLGNQYGAPTIATLGTPSDEQIEQINKSCITVLYTMFDNDAKGAEFTRTMKAKLNKRILVKEVKIPNGKKDIGELTQEEFREAIKKCREM